MTFYLSVRQLLRLHEIQLDKFGGLAGLRDRGGLEAAAGRPQMTFGGEDLYPDLVANGTELGASDGEIVDGTLAVAGGEVSAEALAIWFRQRLQPRNR